VGNTCFDAASCFEVSSSLGYLLPFRGNNDLGGVTYVFTAYVAQWDSTVSSRDHCEIMTIPTSMKWCPELILRLLSRILSLLIVLLLKVVDCVEGRHISLVI
jgi:hypothetical protein